MITALTNNTNSGCREGYPKRGDGSLPDTPYDLCVSHEEQITITNPVNKKPFMKCHDYVDPPCTLLKHLILQPVSLDVPPDLIPQLSC